MRLIGGLLILVLACVSHAAFAQPRISIDRESLSAAILAETNRERAAHGLRQLRSDPRLIRAADGHTKFLTLIGTIQHNSFLPRRHTVEERVFAEGVKASIVSENIARIPMRSLLIRNRGSGNDGVEVTSTDAPEVGLEELAALFVRAWLDSPGHRRNLLHPDVTHLGCAVQTGNGPVTVTFVYSTQVFARL